MWKRTKQHVAFDSRMAQSLLEAAPVPLLIVNQEARIRHLNDAALRLLGGSRRKFESCLCGEAIGCENTQGGQTSCGQSAACNDCPVRSAAANFQSKSFDTYSEMRIRPKRKGVGLDCWVRIHTAGVSWENEPHVLVALIDITRQQQAEQDLLKMNETLEIQNRALAESRESAVKLMDQESQARAQAQELNATLAIQNKALGDSQAAAVKLMEEAKQARRHSEQLNEQLSAAVQRANEMAQKADEANQAKSDFLANMSHEIRTPMNAILGFSELLASESLTDDQMEHLNIIRDAGHNLLDLINDILDFSKIEAGKLETEIIECSLGSILGSIEGLMHPAARDKGLDFQVIQNNAIPELIYTDPTRVRQCLINLINNAIKFTQEGHVYLHVSLEELENGFWVLLQVADTGTGIPAEKLETIFDAFTQAEAATSRKFGGTGLGLAITRKLIELLGGSITVESKPDQGSVFSLTLPVGEHIDTTQLIEDYRMSHDVHSNEDVQNQQPLTGKVLVAEDNQSNQMLVKLLLNKMGLEPVMADDGLIALEKVQAESFDLILMDMQMPNMNGYEATESLREQGHKMPIVALTANAMKGDDQKCLNAGCNDYLSKPIRQADLYQCMAKYLSGSGDCPAGAQTGSGSTKESEPRDPILVSDLENDPDLSPVIDVFLKDIPGLIKKLTDAVEQSDAELLQNIAHQAKGASGSAGFGLLSERIAEIEQSAAETGEVIRLKQSVDEICRICEQIRQVQSKES